jgi:hypothetical protein
MQVEQSGRMAVAAPMVDRFAEVRAYLGALGSHVARGEPLDLTCMLIVIRSIVGLAPALGLPETKKRAQTLQIVMRGIAARNGTATGEELGVMTRSYRRLTAAARDEGAF